MMLSTASLATGSIAGIAILAQTGGTDLVSSAPAWLLGASSLLLAIGAAVDRLREMWYGAKKIAEKDARIADLEAARVDAEKRVSAADARAQAADHRADDLRSDGDSRVQAADRRAKEAVDRADAAQDEHSRAMIARDGAEKARADDSEKRWAGRYKILADANLEVVAEKDARIADLQNQVNTLTAQLKTASESNRKIADAMIAESPRPIAQLQAESVALAAKEKGLIS